MTIAVEAKEWTVNKMADYIDRQAAINEFESLPNCYNGFSDTYDKACIIGVLEEIPSADVEPVRHWRLIDAEELKELFRETITGIATRTDMKGAYEHMIRASAMVIEMIDDAPTVIEASEDGEQNE